MIKKRSLVLSLPLLTGWRHERALLSNDNRCRHHKRPITWFVGKHVPLWFKAASFENVTWTLPFYSWAAHSSGLWPGLHRGLGPTHSLHRPHHNHLYTVTWQTVALLDINHLNFLGEYITVKPLVKRTRKSTQVFDFRSTCVSFGHPLALTLVELNSFTPESDQSKCSPFELYPQIWST